MNARAELEFCAVCKDLRENHRGDHCLFIPGGKFKLMEGCGLCIENPGYREIFDYYDGYAYTLCSCELADLVSEVKRKRKKVR
jgi:hypothetical protein